MCIIKAIKESKKRKEVLAMDDVDLDKAVKIQGTQYDRKRKFTDAQVKQMIKLLGKGTKAKALAESFGTTVHTIKYNTDPIYRQAAINSRSGKHTGVTNMDFDNRVEYKRELVRTKKIKVGAI